MIKILQISLIVSLFITAKEIIAKIIGKRARKIILEKIVITNKYQVNKEAIKGLIIFFGIFLLALLSGYNLLFSTIFGVISIGVLKGTKILKKGFRKKQILQDLLNVSECLRVQISSQIPLGNALRTLPELCENKEFGALLTNIYLEYELSKFVIFDSAEVLLDKFGYSQMRNFISALNQQIQGASAIEAFDSLIVELREKYIEFLEESTKSKMAIMTMGVFIIVINVAVIGIYPIAVEAFNAMNIMLK